MSSQLIDLSHTITDGMVTYPGLPPVRVGTYLGREQSRANYAPDTCFHIGEIQMVANTGTYIDAPFHRFDQAADIAGLPLESLANLPGLLFEGPAGGRAINAQMLDPLAVSGRAVLIYTGWSKHWGSAAYADGHPYLSDDAARLLVERGAALVGIDSLNIDDTRDGTRPAHTRLLEAGIPIVEHLTGLSALAARSFRFFAVPAPVCGIDSFPVRAFALVNDDSAEIRKEAAS